MHEQKFLHRNLSTNAVKFAKEEVWNFIQTHADRPLLMSFGADGTPAKLRTRHQIKLDSSCTVFRRGHEAVEFVVQRLFLLARRYDGVDIATRAARPIPKNTR